MNVVSGVAVPFLDGLKFGLQFCDTLANLRQFRSAAR